MKVKRLKELLDGMDDDLEIFIRNSFNICGNIGGLEQVEVASYGFFGESIPCLIFNTDVAKEIETNENDEYLDFIIIDC